MDLDQRSIPQVILKSCTTPFEIGATEPMALALCTWTALLLGELYLFFSAFGRVYGAYGFSTQQVGLSFIGLGIGIVGGTSAHPVWAGYYRRVTEATGKRPPPEEHLRKGLYGAVLCPLSLFWFAWTTANYVSTPWPSLVATVPFGLGLVWSFQAVFVYLVDAYRPVAASAMSLNSAMRCVANSLSLLIRRTDSSLTRSSVSVCTGPHSRACSRSSRRTCSTAWATPGRSRCAHSCFLPSCLSPSCSSSSDTSTARTRGSPTPPESDQSSSFLGHMRVGFPSALGAGVVDRLNAVCTPIALAYMI